MANDQGRGWEPTPVHLLTLQEVAEMLRKSESQLRWMVHTGSAPPSAKIGGRRMFREKDVIEWIDAQFEDGKAEGMRRSAPKFNDWASVDEYERDDRG